MQVNFIYCFNDNLKSDLINNGFELLSEIEKRNSKKISVFQNNLKASFKFQNYNKKDYMFTNKMSF